MNIVGRGVYEVYTDCHSLPFKFSLVDVYQRSGSSRIRHFDLNRIRLLTRTYHYNWLDPE